ncbi:hypothetical protein ATKI12_8426 [Kitasatospora sp. Ki12]
MSGQAPGNPEVAGRPVRPDPGGDVELLDIGRIHTGLRMPDCLGSTVLRLGSIPTPVRLNG